MIKLSYNSTLYSYDGNTEAAITNASELGIEIHSQITDLSSANLIYEQEGVGAQSVALIGNVASIPGVNLKSGPLTLYLQIEGKLSNGFTVRITKLATPSGLVDDDPVFTVDRDKRIIAIPDTQSILAVVRDENSEIIKFKFPRYADGVDLSTKTAYVNFVNAAGNAYKSLLSAPQIDGDYVLVSWIVGEYVTVQEGNILFQVEFFSEAYRWQTQVAQLSVVRSLEAEASEPLQDQTLLEEYLVRFNELIADAITPTIGENGNWYIGNTDTGKPSRGGKGADATDEQVQAATDAWLEAHPEATTTVQDGSITEQKLSDSLAEKVASAGYVYDEDGAKYSMAVVDGEIVLTRVYEQFPGKEIVADFTPEDCVAIDGATGNIKYKLYNRATGEWNRLFFTGSEFLGQIQPFVDIASATSMSGTKARDLLLANSTGAVSFVFVVNNAAKIVNENCGYYLGTSNGFYNFFGSNGWDSLAVKLGVQYINTAGESATFTLSKTELETKLSDTAYSKDAQYNSGRWTEAIIAFSFNADGTISVLYDDMEMYRATISDWQAWDWENEFKLQANCTSVLPYGSLQNHDRVTIVNDAITLQDLADYYNYIKLTRPATGIASQDAIYLQPGDEVKLYAKASPDGTADTIKAEIADQTVAAYDGERITGLANGSTTLKLTAGSITKDVQIYVGQQTGETITSERTITEIAIANPISELLVGDEWALYAIAKTADAVPYDVADDNIVTMSSSAPDVVAVEFGVLRARAVGTATITVTDHTGSISKTMDVTVVAADDLTVPERDVYHVDDRAHNIYNDGTHPQETTVGLQAALNYAAEQNYRKIVFNPGTYLCNADYGVLTIPSGMIVDFSGAEIHLEYGSQAAAGYTFITIDGGVKTVLRNLTVYAENAVQTGGSTNDITLCIKGDSSRVRVENCAFLDSPGFNVSCHYTRTVVVGFKLSNVEAGGINADGTPETEAVSGRFRAKDYIDISKVGTTFGLGNMQGFQGYLYMRARLYDIYFYDSDKNLISSIKDCVQYQQYDKPDGAAYCKIVFYQADAPTSGDPDYASIAHIYTATQPRFCTFKDCRFERAVMTGLSPQGCIALTLDGCIFADNGSADPYAHIDWEDGRQHMQGHIVRDCSFAQSASKWHCCVEAPGGGRNIVMHGCTVQGGSVSVGSESQNWRMYHNDFRGTTVSLASKGDMVFAGNIVKAAPTTEAPVGGTIHLLDNTITG